MRAVSAGKKSVGINCDAVCEARSNPSVRITRPSLKVKPSCFSPV